MLCLLDVYICKMFRLHDSLLKYPAVLCIYNTYGIAINVGAYVIINNLK